MLTGSHDTPSLAWKSFLFLVTSSLFISCVSFKPAHTLPPTTTYLKKSFSSPNYTLPYRILYPKGYDGTTKYPLVFFLHGSGERGTDNEKHLIHGAQLFLDSIDKYPSIVIFPQCNHSDYWANIEPTQLSLPDDTLILFQKIEQPGPSATALNLLVDSFLNEPTTDLARIYIAGLSMGGMGTAQILATRPNTFAAATVICGAAPLDYVQQLRQTPTQLFQGMQDNVVFPINSQLYYDAINDGSTKHRLILYPNADHQSWNNAFAETDFLRWMFDKKK